MYKGSEIAKDTGGESKRNLNSTFIYLQNEQSHRQTATWEPHLTLTFVRQIAGKDTGVKPDDFHFFSFEIEINLYSVEKRKT